MVVEVDLHRVHSQPEEYLPPKEDQARNILSLDTYGFILNMDKHGNVTETDTSDVSALPLFRQEQLRIKNMDHWKIISHNASVWVFKRPERRKKKLIIACRQGIPHSLRAQLWPRLRNIRQMIDSHPPNHYRKLVDQAVEEHSHVHRSLQETIERDLMRTYPRHSLFYDKNNAPDEESGERQGSPTLPMSDHEDVTEEDVATNIIQELEEQEPPHVNGNGDAQISIHDAQEGHAKLRRVLKAYSMYDKQVGYCQGMNFIAGMFLTVIDDEEVCFWMLVSVMKDEPTRMRSLFLEGMRETHKVLFVAEKLIEKFLPKLHKHFQQEHIHVTMFATQWLLTQYTSSFPFDLVLRFWDCFLAEGWKITYRVMLALLQKTQNDLLRLHFEDVLAYFREIPDNVRGDSIMDLAMKIPLKRSHIAVNEKEFDKQPREGFGS